jgi:hypothetical protein
VDFCISSGTVCQSSCPRKCVYLIFNSAVFIKGVRGTEIVESMCMYLDEY